MGAQVSCLGPSCLRPRDRMSKVVVVAVEGGRKPQTCYRFEDAEVERFVDPTGKLMDDLVGQLGDGRNGDGDCAYAGCFVVEGAAAAVLLVVVAVVVVVVVVSIWTETTKNGALDRTEYCYRCCCWNCWRHCCWRRSCLDLKAHVPDTTNPMGPVAASF